MASRRDITHDLRLHWYTDRAWALHVDSGNARAAAVAALWEAADRNDDAAFRRAVGLSAPGDDGHEGHRDVFDRALLKSATATTVGGGDETVTLLHFLATLSPLRRGMMRLVAEADPAALLAVTSVRGEAPAHWAAAAGNLPALDLLACLAENFLPEGGRRQVMLSSGRGGGGGTFGGTVAHFAAANAKLLVLAYVAAHHPDLLNQADDLGMTPLHVAAELNQERSLLLLAERINSNGNQDANRNNAADGPLATALVQEDGRGRTVLDTVRWHMRASRCPVGMDLSRMLVARDRTAPVGWLWAALGQGKLYERSVRILPVRLSRALWTSGRRALTAMPIAVVVIALALSFVGMFWWPGVAWTLLAPDVRDDDDELMERTTPSSEYGRPPAALLAWAVSTLVLVGSLVRLQQLDPGRVAVDGGARRRFRAAVLEHPNHSTVLEPTVMDAGAPVTLSSREFCPFCEIGRPAGGGNDGAPVEHCLTSNRCVVGLDHWCPWTASCVAHGNIVTFRVFVVATLFTVATYVRAFYAHRLPVCLSRAHGRGMLHTSAGVSWWEAFVCVLNGPVVHSLLLLFLFVPLFLFAGAIAWTQAAFWKRGVTKVGSERLDHAAKTRRINVCGASFCPAVANGRVVLV